MTAKTTPHKAAQLTTKRRGRARTLSSSHKDAVRHEGRRMSATVDRYLRALHTPKRRGRKVSKTRLGERLVSADMRAKSATGVDRVVASQEARELRDRLAALHAAESLDIAILEAEFVRVAKHFSGEPGNSGYGAWREAGVPSAVLIRAGIARTCG